MHTIAESVTRRGVHSEKTVLPHVLKTRYTFQSC
jgi:hypothetical protein